METVVQRITSEEKAKKLHAIYNWFMGILKDLNQFTEHDQLRILLCAHDLKLSHPQILKKLNELVHQDQMNPSDYVIGYMRQLIYLKFDIAPDKRKSFIVHMIEKENHVIETDVTQAYYMGYALEKENDLSPELRKKAIQWLVDHPNVPSASLLAWTIYFLAKNGQKEEALKRKSLLLEDRWKNGSWNDFPEQTVNIAYPLSVSGVFSEEELEITTSYLMKVNWDNPELRMNFKTTLLKYLKATNQLNY